MMPSQANPNVVRWEPLLSERASWYHFPFGVVFLLAQVDLESGGDPNSVSTFRSSDVGLGNISSLFIYQEEGFSDAANFRNALFNPCYNADLLVKLMTQYVIANKGDLTLALLEYNTGGNTWTGQGVSYVQEVFKRVPWYL